MEYKNLLVAFFLINAVFWGLMPHSTHCEFVSKLGITTCPPHYIHVYILGLGSFIMALYLLQGNTGLKM